MLNKLDFSAVYGHQEVSPEPEATETLTAAAKPALDFSAIHGHIQHSDSVVPEATTLGKVTKDVDQPEFLYHGE